MDKHNQIERVEFVEEELTFKPVTSHEWADLVILFSEHGVQKGCWCMYWRIPRKEFQRNYGDGNKRLFKQVLEFGNVPGVLAYHKRKPVGWCSIAPREDFPVILRSPTLKPIDDQPVWSIVCFFVSEPYRKSGLSHLLIRAAVEYAKKHGARIIEAYPVDARAKSIEFERYVGLTTTYEKEGFKEVLRRSERKAIMRYYVDDKLTQA